MPIYLYTCIYTSIYKGSKDSVDLRSFINKIKKGSRAVNMKDLNKIEISLNKLHAEFNSQLNTLGDNPKAFHTALIELSTKYPEHKELLQFIVHINDKLETNHTLFSDVIIDSFNELIQIKKDMLQKLVEIMETIEEIEQKEGQIKDDKTSGTLKKILKIPANIKDIKILAFYLAIIAVILGAVFIPGKVTAILNAIAKLV